ncbi:MAG: HlyD family secretion protein [Acetobacteraceae bacterium]
MPSETLDQPRKRQDEPRRTVEDTEPGRKMTPRRRLLRWGLILGGALILAVGGVAYWLSGGRYITTDNAYVQADVLNVATDVSGIVASIPVKEGQTVQAGDVLFRLDPMKFQLALDQARANLQQVSLNLQALKSDYVKATSTRAAQQAIVRNDQATLDRAEALVKQHDISQQQYDAALYKLQSDQAQLAAAQAEEQSALARLGGNADSPVTEMPAYREAQSALGEAARELDHAVVRAPYDGTVTQVAKLQPGQFLPAGTPAFGLVGSDTFWAAAQPKETELTHARAGQTATVTVDAYPGYTWQGVVQSIAPATDQQFAILPAQNSSGNWVKVVQRVPVRVSLKPLPGAPPLSAGMSAEVSIDTHHERHLSDLL